MIPAAWAVLAVEHRRRGSAGDTGVVVDLVHDAVVRDDGSGVGADGVAVADVEVTDVGLGTKRTDLSVRIGQTGVVDCRTAPATFRAGPVRVRVHG